MRTVLFMLYGASNFADYMVLTNKSSILQKTREKEYRKKVEIYSPHQTNTLFSFFYYPLPL